ncbi:MAG: VWA domain-containing protein [Hyphomicrobiales bacterium]|nr:VWA domain-containing protein [Hyphomicrobiales bacterium]
MSQRRGILGRVLRAMAATAMLAAAGPAFGAEANKTQPNVMLILDSSRSMWGQIDGINKVVIARTVVGQMAERYADSLNIGVLAYGHRQSAGCSDVEVVLPLGKHKPKRIAKVVNAIKPKGSTPIAASLTKAASAARTDKRPVRFVLISDGLDNCKGDPCATAAKLKSKAKDLTIDVIAFDRRNKKALEKLSCIADRSDGTFASATSEKELLAALDTVMGAAAAPPTAAAAPARPAQLPPIAAAPKPMPAAPEALSADPIVTGTVQQKTAQAPAPTQSNAAAKTGAARPEVPQTPQSTAPVPVTLSALLTETGPKIENGLVWRIFEAKPNKDGKYKLVSTHRDATPTAALPPGDYLVNAAYGLSNLTRKITVQAGRSLEESFSLNAGGLRLGAVLANGGAVPPNAVRYDIYADEADQFGNRERVMADAKPGLIIRLNAGAYHIVSVYGDANAKVRADVTVEPGRLTEATINHTAAKVTFKLVLQPGGEALADTTWSILTPGGDVVKESAGALPTHILAAGSYTVLARYNGKNYTRDFALEAGDVKQVEVVIR